MRQQPAVNDPTERERQIAREVKDALAEEVTDGLRVLGFTVARVSRGTVAMGSELLIDGQFLTVDEGSPLHRLVLEFSTRSDSGMMPGAAPTLGAGAAVQGGVTAGMVVANAAVSGVETYNSEVARMAAASGDQVVRYLSEFFAQQGWIRADQVRKARIAY